MFNTQFLYQQEAHFILYLRYIMTFQVYIIILYLYDYKVNRSTKSVIFTHFKKSSKKKGLPKKIL